MLRLFCSALNHPERHFTFMVKPKAKKPTSPTPTKKPSRSRRKPARNRVQRPPKKHPAPRNSRSSPPSVQLGSPKANGNGAVHISGPKAKGSPNSHPVVPTVKSQSGIDLTEKIKELVRLAQE